MADGNTRMLPEEARDKAEQMKKLAENIEALLNDVDAKMQEINDEETGTYQGKYKPSELRSELDSFRATFYQASGQIKLFATDVITTANTMLSE